MHVARVANVIARDLLANTDEFTEDWGLKADALLAPLLKTSKYGLSFSMI